MHPHTKHTLRHALFFLVLVIVAIALGLFLLRAPAPTTNTNFGNLTQIYENTATSPAYSIRYPSDYTLDNTHVYTEMGPGKFLTGVAFTIATSTFAGTNLSPDSYLSVESLEGRTETTGNLDACAPSLFLDNASPTQTVTENGVEYAVASSTGAAAGNRYEETVYVLQGAVHPCLAVRYFIHYGVIENYPTGTVKAFDKQALLGQFDAIRKTLTILTVK